MRELAWINGKTMALADACIPLEDRGFFFGDGIYEVCRIYEAKPFYLQEHLQRLQDSAAEILLALPFSSAELANIALDLIREADCREGWLYLQVTRGTAPRTHAFPPAHVKPTLVLFVRPITPDRVGDTAGGAACITIPDTRWLHCNVKTINLLPNLLAKEKAKQAGAYDAIFYRPGGVISEASASNIFALIDGTVRTHPLSNLILPGITRRVVLKIMERLSLDYDERAFTVDELKVATEVWLTASVSEIVPVTSVDGKPVGDGAPGELVKRLIEEYGKVVRQYCRD
ncbi:MAG: D-amino-acid transaminase [Bacillota bacterium]